MTAGATVAEALRKAQDRLAEAGVDAPRLQAVALLGHVLGLERAGVLARLRDPLEAGPAGRFTGLVDRRVAREPLQYLLGRAPFLDFEVEVGPGVFIPRPETEGVVERALSAWSGEPPLAVDLCTGSGAIAIAIARARPEGRVLAVDVSAVALRTARRNARSLGVRDRVRFVRGDLLRGLRSAPRVGILVCNPPYARRGDVVQPEVRDHEPELAWAGGERGTEVYERLAAEAATVLTSGRPMVLELGHDQAPAVRGLLEAHGGWRDVVIDDDFQGIPRVLTARRV